MNQDMGQYNVGLHTLGLNYNLCLRYTRVYSLEVNRYSFQRMRIWLDYLDLHGIQMMDRMETVRKDLLEFLLFEVVEVVVHNILGKDRLFLGIMERFYLNI